MDEIDQQRKKYHLSERQIEVLDLLICGLSNREIATLLSITEETTKSHVRLLLAKLDARNRVYATTLAWEHGLVTIRTLNDTRNRLRKLMKKPAKGPHFSQVGR